MHMFVVNVFCIVMYCQAGEQDYSSELAALQREGEMPIEDLLATLPEALLSGNVTPLTPSSGEDDEAEENNGMLTVVCCIGLHLIWVASFDFTCWISSLISITLL